MNHQIGQMKPCCFIPLQKLSLCKAYELVGTITQNEVENALAESIEVENALAESILCSF